MGLDNTLGFRSAKRVALYQCAKYEIIPRCRRENLETGLLVGYGPGFPGAHSQGATMDELGDNLKEVLEMLLEDGDPVIEAEFVGTQLIRIA